MHARGIGIALGALLLSLGIAGSAHAAPFVDVTYDLSESTVRVFAITDLFENGVWPVCNDTSQDCNENGTIAGTMKVRYVGTSAGSGIQAGSAYLQSFNFSINSFTQAQQLTQTDPSTAYSTAGTNTKLIYNGKFTWQLQNTPSGAYTGGALNVAAAQLLAHGSFHCDDPAYGGYLCTSFMGVAQSAVTSGTSYSTGSLALNQIAIGSGTAEVTGDIGAIYYYPNGGPFIGGDGTGLAAYTQLQWADFVGREIQRTPIPEPGSLLLLGSGLAGLAAVGGTGAAGWRLRRRRRRD